MVRRCSPKAQIDQEDRAAAGEPKSSGQVSAKLIQGATFARPVGHQPGRSPGSRYALATTASAHAPGATVGDHRRHAVHDPEQLVCTVCRALSMVSSPGPQGAWVPALAKSPDPRRPRCRICIIAGMKAPASVTSGRRAGASRSPRPAGGGDPRCGPTRPDGLPGIRSAARAAPMPLDARRSTRAGPPVRDRRVEGAA